MKNTKLTIDLGNTQLTDEQKQNLLAAVHKAVGSKIKTKNPAKPVKAANKGNKPVNLAAATAQTKTFKLHADFLNVNPGLSELNVTINGQTQALDTSGDLTFTNVTTPRILTISGKSLGTTSISFSVPSVPATKNFQPGTFIFNFTIL